ncbi:MAG TPA: hypothetical protein VFD42_05800, partial [Chloroflexota bacterium]|nr:hypothetical protein [Chloroflexota bacterium]
PLIPLFFFVSSIMAGLSMVIVESTLSHKFFAHQVGADGHHKLDKLTLSLGKAAAVVAFTYFGIKTIGFMHAQGYQYLGTPMGNWYLVEMLGFVLLPCALFFVGASSGRVGLVRTGAVLGVLGIVLNRVNVSMIAFNWQESERYIPRWSEFVITLAIVTLAVLTYRWIVNRMPILYQHPDFDAE